MGEITLTLNSPITEEQWDMIRDVDFDYTDSVTFYTKHGKEVEFVKRKTGKWEICEDMYGDTEATCSECGFATVVDQPGNNLHMLTDLHFCPSCGARMVKEKK